MPRTSNNRRPRRGLRQYRVIGEAMMQPRGEVESGFQFLHERRYPFLGNLPAKIGDPNDQQTRSGRQWTMPVAIFADSGSASPRKST